VRGVRERSESERNHNLKNADLTNTDPNQCQLTILF
jgi:hypothetical protein